MGRAVKPIGATRKRKIASPIDKAKAYEVVWQQVSPLFEAARGFKDISFVYFIGEQDDGPIKIGVSKDPVGRLRQMQTGNSRRLRIEHVLAGDSYTEKVLHEMWEPYAIFSSRSTGRPDAAPGTEWFKHEVRELLLPAIATAAAAQIERLRQGGDVTAEEMETIIRGAHGEHDIVAHKREEQRFFAKDGFSITSGGSRRSRI